MEPAYYAIIPSTVRYSKEVCDGAKLLYGEITALCNKEGYCWATNEYFSSLYSTSNRTISRWISELARAGFLYTIVDNESGNSRKMWLVESQMHDKNVVTSRQKCLPPHDKNVYPLTTKMSTPSRQKCLHNNTVNNTENNTTKSNSEKAAAAGGETSAFKENPSALPPPNSAPPPPPAAAAFRPIGFDIESEAALLVKDPLCLERFAKEFKTDTEKAKDPFARAVSEFVFDQSANQTPYNSTREFRQHFFNWVPRRAAAKKREAEEKKKSSAAPGSSFPAGMRVVGTNLPGA